MGLLTWAKYKLEENWPTSLSKAITKVEGLLDVGQSEKFRVKKKNKFPHKKNAMKGNITMGKTFQKGKNLNNFKARVSNPKENLSRKGFL